MCPLQGTQLVTISVVFVANTRTPKVDSLEFASSDLDVSFIVECSRSVHQLFRSSAILLRGGQAETIHHNFKMNFLLCGTDFSDMCWPSFPISSPEDSFACWQDLS